MAEFDSDVNVTLLQQTEIRGQVLEQGTTVALPARKANRLIRDGVAEKAGAGAEVTFAPYRDEQAALDEQALKSDLENSADTERAARRTIVRGQPGAQGAAVQPGGTLDTDNGHTSKFGV